MSPICSAQRALPSVARHCKAPVIFCASAIMFDRGLTLLLLLFGVCQRDQRDLAIKAVRFGRRPRSAALALSALSRLIRRQIAVGQVNVRQALHNATSDRLEPFRTPESLRDISASDRASELWLNSCGCGDVLAFFEDLPAPDRADKINDASKPRKTPASCARLKYSSACSERDLKPVRLAQFFSC